jgi:putative FmdB family regulatory protein
MPIYEYKCRKCGRQYDAFQKITDPAMTSCKFCKGPVHKLISLSSFHLKGSGWYVTDYGGKKSDQSEKKKEETTTSPPDESKSAKSDSGSETKTD